MAELTLMGNVNEKNEAEVTRLIKQQRERDEAAAAAAGECIHLKHAAERAAADREAAVAAQRRSERTASVLQERISALEVQLQARACPPLEEMPVPCGVWARVLTVNGFALHGQQDALLAFLACVSTLCLRTCWWRAGRWRGCPCAPDRHSRLICMHDPSARL